MQMCTFVVGHLQILHEWSKRLAANYNVKDFINELKDWIREGFVYTTIWERLQNYISADVLPTFMEGSPLFSTSLASHLVADSAEKQMGEPVQEVGPFSH